MACTHKFIRGKNKGETCLRLLAKDSADKCATHSRVLKKKQPVVDNTCLCGNTCGNTVLVLGHSHLCDTCAQQSDIVTCSECDRVGRLGLVQTHFRDCHIPTTMVTNTTMPVDEFLAIDINSLPQPIDTCKLCDFSTNIRDDMVSHATDSHMTEKSCTVETKVVVVPNNSSESVP